VDTAKCDRSLPTRPCADALEQLTCARASGRFDETVFGGQVRIGGSLPQDPIADPPRDPMYNVVVTSNRSDRGWNLVPRAVLTVT
jgi:hypothetical protein